MFALIVQKEICCGEKIALFDVTRTLISSEQSRRIPTHEYGFSSLRVLVCTVELPLFANDFVHTSHGCVSHSMCESLVRFIDSLVTIVIRMRLLYTAFHSLVVYFRRCPARRRFRANNPRVPDDFKSL